MSQQASTNMKSSVLPASPSLRFPLWLILGLFCALIMVQQFVELPANSMLLLALNNAAHTPFFTVLTLVIWQLHPLLPSRLALPRKLRLLAAVMVFLAGFTELTQMFTIRDASLQDWLRNMLGIGAAFCLLLMWQYRGQLGAIKSGALLMLGLALLVYGFRDVIGVMERYQQRLQALPHLLVMEDDYLRRMTRRFGTWRLGDKAEFYAAAGRALPEDPQRDVLLLALDRGNYPGLTLREPYPDWSSYQWLTLEAETPGDVPLAMTVRVETARDRGMENTKEIIVTNVPTTFRLPLSELVKGAAGERRDIRNLLLFVEGPREDRSVLLYDLRLE